VETLIQKKPCPLRQTKVRAKGLNMLEKTFAQSFKIANSFCYRFQQGTKIFTFYD